MFIVMAFCEWEENLKSDYIPFPIVLKPFIDGMIGYSPIFLTKEQAENYSKGRFQVLEISANKEAASDG